MCTRTGVSGAMSIATVDIRLAVSIRRTEPSFVPHAIVPNFSLMKVHVISLLNDWMLFRCLTTKLDDGGEPDDDCCIEEGSGPTEPPSTVGEALREGEVTTDEGEVIPSGDDDWSIDWPVEAAVVTVEDDREPGMMAE